jgi:hypothetical protein
LGGFAGAGATAGGGIGFGLFTSAGKIALLASNPLAAAGAAVGVGGIAFRQAMAFVNQKQRYMVVMAQNHYIQAMADNRSAIGKVAMATAETVREPIGHRIRTLCCRPYKAGAGKSCPQPWAAIAVVASGPLLRISN